MHLIRSTIRPALAMLTLLTLLFGVAYPGVSTLLAQSMFPRQAAGSLIKDPQGSVLGSALIGQHFSAPKYFWGRLSAANYNAAASTGSNLGAAHPALLDAAKARMDALKSAAPGPPQPIPVDLVSASGSGLDPDISVAAAEYQVGRVAAARGVPESEIRAALRRFTSTRQLGMLGEPRVHVLQLNLALDGKL